LLPVMYPALLAWVEFEHRTHCVLRVPQNDAWQAFFSSIVGKALMTCPEKDN
jgi:hypothetical protein